MSPTISVCIPAHGRPEMLKRAVASASDADEVLVYENDDGAPGPSISKAIGDATSEWLMVLADDDWLLPGSIDALKGKLDGDIIFSDLYRADKGGAIFQLWSYRDRPLDPRHLIEWTRFSRNSAIPMLGPWRLAWLREHDLSFLSWDTTHTADDCRTLLEWMRHDPDVRYVPGPFHVYTDHDSQKSKQSSERAKFLVELDAYFKGDS